MKNMTNIPQMTSNVMMTCNSCTPSQLPAFTEIRDRLDGLGSVPKRTDESSKGGLAVPFTGVAKRMVQPYNALL